MDRRVVVLARVSTADKGQDPETQVRAVVAAVERQGWTVVEVVRRTQSAWTARAAREVREAALAPIVEGRADTLAVWAIDRLTRGGIEDTLGLVKHLEGHLGAALYSLQEPWASTATQSPEVRALIMSVMAWVAEQESTRRSARVTAKAEAKRNRAEAVGQRARWGRGAMATREERARAHEMARAGDSVRTIASALSLSKSSVARMLKEPVPAEPLGRGGVAEGNPAPSRGGGLGQGTERNESGGPTEMDADVSMGAGEQNGVDSDGGA